MKKASVLFLAMAALAVTSCSSGEDATEEENQEVQEVTYSLDAAGSSLNWSAAATDGHGHSGAVSFKEGSLTMKGDEVVGGNFVVDMNSITNMDLDENMQAVLEGHLKGTMVDEAHPVNLFFNVPSFPTAEVSLGEFKDGNLDITLSIVGTKLTQSVPVTINGDGSSASISGEFSIDMESTGIMGFQAQEDGSQIGPNVDFVLALNLNK